MSQHSPYAQVEGRLRGNCRCWMQARVPTHAFLTVPGRGSALKKELRGRPRAVRSFRGRSGAEPKCLVRQCAKGAGLATSGRGHKYSKDME